MVFNRHLKALNLCNHSDTIACVLYELLVKFGIDYRGFPNPRSRFHKFQICSIFKVLLCCRVSVTACILYIRNAWLSRGFLKVFWRISSSKNIYRLLWSAFRGVSAARQLDYYSKEYDSCQGLFLIFSTNFESDFWARCILWRWMVIGTRGCDGKVGRAACMPPLHGQPGGSKGQ